MECAARKPGNVHPGASFVDTTFEDFVRSAEVAAPVLATAEKLGIGNTILESVRATRERVRTNTNLGMILLLAPLAAIPAGTALPLGIREVLNSLDMTDAFAVYEAIRLASPGGLGRVDEQDVSSPPELSLIEAMRLGAHRDLIAKQYVTNFEIVLGFGRQIFMEAVQTVPSWNEAIIWTQLSLMAEFPDSLIARKCGEAVALESQRRAQELLEGEKPDFPDGLVEFDRWLRADGHRRNPGTTADLIAAILFAVIRDGMWQPPAEIDVGH